LVSPVGAVEQSRNLKIFIAVTVYCVTDNSPVLPSRPSTRPSSDPPSMFTINDATESTPSKHSNCSSSCSEAAPPPRSPPWTRPRHRTTSSSTRRNFFVAIPAIARQIDDKTSNDDLIRHAITSGLRPNIAGHVMASAAKADPIDELLEAARVAELMTAATPDASAIESLVAERLGNRIDAVRPIHRTPPGHIRRPRTNTTATTPDRPTTEATDKPTQSTTTTPDINNSLQSVKMP
jgi:hypothetical protein